MREVVGEGVGEAESEGGDEGEGEGAEQGKIRVRVRARVGARAREKARARASRSLAIAAHGNVCCPIVAPPALSPSACTSLLTSAVGPTRSEVPVSAMAAVLPTSDLPPTCRGG